MTGGDNLFLYLAANKRNLYDRYGKEGLTNGSGGGESAVVGRFKSAGGAGVPTWVDMGCCLVVLQAAVTTTEATSMKTSPSGTRRMCSGSSSGEPTRLRNSLVSVWTSA